MADGQAEGQGARGSRLDLDSPDFRRKLLATIIQNTPAAYILIDVSYRVRFVNDYMLRFRRLGRGDILGRVCYDVFNGGEPCPICPVREAAADGLGHTVMRKDVLPDGSVVYTDDFAVPVKADGVEGLLLEMQIDRTMEMRLKEKTDSMFLGVIDSMVKILGKKDPYTRLHSSEVSSISAKLTWYMGLGDKAIFNAALGGLLHDLGKLYMPDALLNKKGALDKRETAAIREHPIFTWLVLPDLESFRAIREIAVSHHERWDGSGYPSALAGEDIPMEARIAAVADTYSAMTSDRPYRKGMDHETAMAEIKRHAGTQFDPRVVEKFVQMVEDYSLDKNSLVVPDDTSDSALILDADGYVLRRVSAAPGRRAGPAARGPGGDGADTQAPGGDGADTQAPGGDGADTQAPGGDGADTQAPGMRELAASDSLINTIFDNTPARYLIVDESFNILFASDSFALHVGRPKEELYAMKCFDAKDKGAECFRPEDGCARCPAAKAFASGKEEYGLVKEIIEDRTLYCGIFAVPLELDGVDGAKIRCCLEIMFDQTKEKQAQAKLEGDLRRIVEVLYNLIAELDLEATGNMEEISNEAISFNDYLDRMLAELAELRGPHGAG